MWILLTYFLLGAFAGTMSGLLGIGGGLLVVPGLAFIFDLLHFPAGSVMHMAAGTSLAVMIFTTLRSFIAHLSRHVPFWSIYKRLLPGVVVGTVTGAVVAHFLHSNALKIIFAIVVLLIAAKMLLERKIKINQHHLPRWPGMSLAGFLIGGKSGLLGIGGGALTIPFLTYCNVSMREAVVVSVATGFTVAVIGTISFSITGLHVTGLPRGTIGYIYWWAWLPVTLGSVLFAPLGAKWSHQLPIDWLKRIFAVFLLIIGVHLLGSVYISLG